MILDQLARATARRVEKAKEKLPLEELKAQLYDYRQFDDSIFDEMDERKLDGKQLNGRQLSGFHAREPFAFEKALKNQESSGMAFICEVKKASPSKGVIAQDFPYLEIAREYEEAGATAVSVLTEPDYFQGEDRYLSEISRAVAIPVLRKDFIRDEYQIYEAKRIGADAVLLICSLLDVETLQSFIHISDQLGLSTLVETHSEDEITAALQAGARIIGVNNRNLQTFEVDLNTSIRLRELVPEKLLFVAESGIHGLEDVGRLRKAGVDAVLIGEALMRSTDKKELLTAMRRS